MYRNTRILIGTIRNRIFHAHNLSAALSKLGVECKVVLDSETYDGFPYRKTFQTRRRIHKLFDEFRPSAVMGTYPNLFCIATLDRNIPLLLQLRGDYWSEMKWLKDTICRNPLKRSVLYFKDRIARRCFTESAMILPVSNYLKGIVDQKYPDKSTTIYTGMNPDIWNGDSASAVGDVEGRVDINHPCVGLLQNANVWGKAREMLVLPKVMKALPHVTFYWAGDGIYRDRVLPELLKCDNFVWLGNMSDRDAVRKYLAEIDVYALISGIDMLPNSVREAELMEKPVIATNVGGIPEVMQDGVTGHLVESGNAAQMTSRICDLLGNAKTSRKMGRMGKKLVEEKFNWDRIASDFIKAVTPVLR